jgi:hypothetical protein
MAFALYFATKAPHLWADDEGVYLDLKLLRQQRDTLLRLTSLKDNSIVADDSLDLEGVINLIDCILDNLETEAANDNPQS